ncbi:hypothetical protein KC460_01530 [Candidatus Dependentiae bacterium]|nr:hypothetical protein [Candidatus Dependentiae bacterium]
MKKHIFIFITFMSISHKTIFCMDEKQIHKHNQEKFRKTVQRYESEKLILALNDGDIKLAKTLITFGWIDFSQNNNYYPTISYLISTLRNEEIDKAMQKRVGTQKAKELICAIQKKDIQKAEKLINQNWIDYSTTDKNNKTFAQLIYELDNPKVTIAFIMNAPDKFTSPLIIKNQKDLDADAIKADQNHNQRIKHSAPEEIKYLDKLRNNKTQ